MTRRVTLTVGSETYTAYVRVAPDTPRDLAYSAWQELLAWLDRAGAPAVPPPAQTIAPSPSWTLAALWDTWRQTAARHGARLPLLASTRDLEHLDVLITSYPQDQLRALIATWWQIPTARTGGRSLGLFRAQLGELSAHLAQGGTASTFRAPEPAPREERAAIEAEARAYRERLRREGRP
jgi:hypothetical protein